MSGFDIGEMAAELTGTTNMSDAPTADDALPHSWADAVEEHDAINAERDARNSAEPPASDAADSDGAEPPASHPASRCRFLPCRKSASAASSSTPNWSKSALRENSCSSRSHSCRPPINRRKSRSSLMTRKAMCAPSPSNSSSAKRTCSSSSMCVSFRTMPGSRRQRLSPPSALLSRR